MPKKTPDDIFKLAKDENIEDVDVRFCDLPGTMQHFTIPIYAFDENVFEERLAFDGSSIRGFQSIHESDMLLLPDPETAIIDPFRAAKTLNVNFFVHDPFTLELYSRDPRDVARKAENCVFAGSRRSSVGLPVKQRARWSPAGSRAARGRFRRRSR